jgi:hypothetical protein
MLCAFVNCAKTVLPGIGHGAIVLTNRHPSLHFPVANCGWVEFLMFRFMIVNCGIKKDLFQVRNEFSPSTYKLVAAIKKTLQRPRALREGGGGGNSLKISAPLHFIDTLSNETTLA